MTLRRVILVFFLLAALANGVMAWQYRQRLQDVLVARDENIRVYADAQAQYQQANNMVLEAIEKMREANWTLTQAQALLAYTSTCHDL